MLACALTATIQKILIATAIADSTPIESPLIIFSGGPYLASVKAFAGS